MISRLSTGLLFALAAAGPAAAACDAFQPYALPYRVTYGDTTLGDGGIALFAADDAGCYIMRETAEPSFLARLLSGDIEEESRFCLKDGRIVPSHFHYRRGGIGGKKENFAVRFDWAAHKIEGGDFGTAALDEGVMDRLSAQLYVRDWICKSVSRTGKPPADVLAVRYVEKSGIQDFRFQVKGEEKIRVPAGEYDAVRVDRIFPAGRSNQFWLARDHDYVIVRAQQWRGDKKTLGLQLLKWPKAE